MKRMRELRKGKGLSGEKLGGIVGVQKSAISKYERGEIQPSNEVLLLIANTLNTSTDYLLGNTDDPTPPDAKKAPILEGFDSDPLLAFYGGVKEHLSQDDLDDIKTIMEAKAKRNKGKKNEESGRNDL